MTKPHRSAWGVIVLALGIHLPACSPPTPTASTEFDASDYDPERGLVVVEVNWGRKWKCGDFENAQLQHLKFTSPSDQIDLRPASVLSARDEFATYVLPVAPGEYTLDEFGVKVAKSVSEVGHLKKHPLVAPRPPPRWEEASPCPLGKSYT